MKNHSLLGIIKNELKKEGMKFDKGSRQSFIVRLIDTRAILAKKDEINRLDQILNEYIEAIQKEFKLPKTPTPTDLLKYTLNFLF